MATLELQEAATTPQQHAPPEVNDRSCGIRGTAENRVRVGSPPTRAPERTPPAGGGSPDSKRRSFGRPFSGSRPLSATRFLRPLSGSWAKQGGQRRPVGKDADAREKQELAAAKEAAAKEGDTTPKRASEVITNLAMGSIGEALLRQLNVAGLAVGDASDDFLAARVGAGGLGSSKAVERTSSQKDRQIEIENQEQTNRKEAAFQRQTNSVHEKKVDKPKKSHRSNRQLLMLQLAEAEDEAVEPTRSTFSRDFTGCCPTLRRRIRLISRNLVMSPKFDGCVALIVMINSFTMALESEVEHAESFFKNLDWFYNVVYSLEAFCRWVVYGRSYFKAWVNILDFVIVVCGWLTSIGGLFENSGVMDSISALKVLRALRALRFCRMISFFEGIWIVFTSFIRCMRPLFWTCLFVFVIIFIFTMFAVELIGTSDEFKDIESQKKFSRTILSFVSLFQVMTLDEWRSVTQPLMDQTWWAYLFFVFYICISSLALMNLVTAVIVENTMMAVQQDDEHVKLEMAQKRQVEKEQIANLFHHFDSGRSRYGDMHHDGVVSPADVANIRNSWGALQAIFDSLDIHDQEDIARLMILLDSDGSGDISLTELLEGMMDLRALSEDSNRVALLHVIHNKDHKFEIIERVIAQMRAPNTIEKLLQRVEVCLSDFGICPVPKFADEVLEENATRSGKGSTSAESPVCRSTAATSSPPGDKKAGNRIRSRSPTSTVKPEEPERLAAADSRELLRKLRRMRLGLERNSEDLQEQREEIESLQKVVDTLRQDKENSRYKRVNSRSRLSQVANEQKKGLVVKDHLMEMILNSRRNISDKWHYD